MALPFSRYAKVAIQTLDFNAAKPTTLKRIDWLNVEPMKLPPIGLICYQSSSSASSLPLRRTSLVHLHNLSSAQRFVCLQNLFVPNLLKNHYQVIPDEIA